MKNNEFYNKIAEDSKQTLIQLLSEAGHGKTSSLRTIVQYVKDKYPEIEFVIFDVSQAWYHNAPVTHRQLITPEKLYATQYDKITDCVYEMGMLNKDERRAFVGEFVKTYYDERYQAGLDGRLDDYSNLMFVFEEANTYFGSYSLKQNDIYTPVFVDYVSVGRNYKLRGFLIATVEVGEVSTNIRRRSRKIYGRLESESDLAQIRRRDKELGVYLKEIPKYHFVYYSRKAYHSGNIPDAVRHQPVDYVINRPIRGSEVDLVEGKKTPWWRYAVVAIVFYTLGWLLC